MTNYFPARHKFKTLYALGAAAITKISMLAVLKFVALTVLVFKAVIVSKLALAAAVVLGISRLLHNQPHAVTYEVVSHPHHLDHHDAYSAGTSSYSSGATAGGVGYARADHLSPYRAHAAAAPARKPAQA